MGKKRKGEQKKQKVTKADLLEADRRAAEQGTGETDRVKRIREYRSEPAKRRSVDNDILFELPSGKAMTAVLAVGLVLYVVSCVLSMLGAADIQSVPRYASYALFVVSFVLFVFARTKAKRLTAERRASEE